MRLSLRPLRYVMVVVVMAGLASDATRDAVRPNGAASDTGAAASAAPLPAGRLVRDWEILSGSRWPAGYDPASKVILFYTVALPNEMVHQMQTAVDARTGSQRWQLEGPGTWLTEDGEYTPLITIDGMAFLREHDSFSDDGVLTAVRIRDGRTLWTTADLSEALAVGGDLIGIVDGTVRAMAVATGVARWNRPLPDDCDGPQLTRSMTVVLALRCGDSLYGLQHTDGAVVWSWTAPDTCVIENFAGSNAIAAVVATCPDDRATVHLLDPRSGTRTGTAATEWRPAEADPGDPGRGAPRAQVDGDAVLVVDDGGLSLVDRAGRQVWAMPDMRCHGTPCLLRTTATAVVSALPRQGSDGIGRLIGIDPRTGQVRWTQQARNHEMTLDDGLLYLLEDLPEPFWSKHVRVVQPTTGELHEAVVPIDNGTQLLAVDAGLLYLSYTSYTTTDFERAVSAYRFDGGRKGLLGGADAERWPEPCQLLTTADLRQVRPNAEYSSPHPGRLAVGALATAVTTMCTWLPQRASDTKVTASVVWTSPDAAEAKAYAEQYVGFSHRRTLDGVADMAAVRDATVVGLGPTDLRVVLVVGGCVVELSTPGDDRLSTELARTVARRLAETATSGKCRNA